MFRKVVIWQHGAGFEPTRMYPWRPQNNNLPEHLSYAEFLAPKLLHFEVESVYTKIFQDNAESRNPNDRRFLFFP